jgi:Toxin with a H, D/N and C signature
MQVANILSVIDVPVSLWNLGRGAWNGLRALSGRNKAKDAAQAAGAVRAAGTTGRAVETAAEGGAAVPTVRELAPADSIIKDELIDEFYAMRTETGGRVWVSEGDTRQIGGVLETVGLEARSGEPVTLLSGAHGTQAGELVPNSAFFMEDMNYFSLTRPNVRVLDVTTLSGAELATILKGAGATICGWCYSDRSLIVSRALGLGK